MTPEAEASTALLAAIVVLMETLHKHRVIDRKHFAHAFASALDNLEPELRTPVIVACLNNLKNSAIGDPDADTKGTVSALLKRKFFGKPLSAKSQ